MGEQPWNEQPLDEQPLNEQPFMVEALADAARQNVSATFGESDPDVVETIVTDLHEREHLDDAVISDLPPDELDQLDERYGWHQEN
ncbi:hypothetical protein HS041_21620 [Planomonospora sp. ID67723]|uniref:hypothetical protein n=1 Tax=Planomonospora sp. ID67723 TaxID=2738134 RepID=UPI0018C398D9|nr:hypothetical protein [Planomonospora sp. ID67723]MBG0830367.1 hypothetical protein [Planomonospora sp. ID67723]